jgi:hypothetical protein
MDAAMAAGLCVSGWCPPGRAAEDGPVPERYPLDQTPLERSPLAPAVPRSQRTEWTIRDADAVMLLTMGEPRDAGTRAALDFARHYGRPVLLVDLDAGDGGAAEGSVEDGSASQRPPTAPVQRAGPDAAMVRAWLDEHDVKRLGVGGPKASDAPAVYERAYALLRVVFCAP